METIIRTHDALDLEEIKKGFRECALPERMLPGIELYLTEGVLPGEFLLSVLRNDLRNASMFADHENFPIIGYWGLFCSNYLPSPCWGDAVTTLQWQITVREKRTQERGE